MVLNKLTFTDAVSDELPPTKPAKPPRKKAKTSSATPGTSGRGTPASASTNDRPISHSTPTSANTVEDYSSRQGTVARERLLEKREPGRTFTELTRASAGPTKVSADRAATSSTTLPRDDDIIETTEADTAAQAIEAEEQAGATILDPRVSERQYYRDPFTGSQREVWRPGDGDGDRSADYYEKPGPAAPVERRWRFYQSRTGNAPIKRDVNEPPRYVLLDDRAAYEALSSDIPRNKLTDWWSHDFGGQGKVRVRRTHRGRPAIAEPDTEGDKKYHFGQIGTKNDKYYFTGEKDYKPIIYINNEHESAQTPASAAKRKATSTPTSERDPKKRGHNQFTPKDQLVKYGAPHSGSTHQRYRPRLNAFLTRDPSPDLPFDKAVLFGQEPHHPTKDMFAASMALQDVLGDVEPVEDGEGMWVEQDDQKAKKRRKDVIMDVDAEVEEQEFPFASRPSTKTISMLDSPADEPTRPRRKKLPQQSDIFESMFAGSTAGFGGAGEENMAVDSGSYASQLERELEEAKRIIEEQKRKISGLETAVQQAEAKMAVLKDELAALKGDTAMEDSG